MGFMDLGDTAPDDRFTFRYLCEECTTAPERAVTFDTANRTVSLPTAQAVQTGVSYETKLVDRTVNTLFDMERERAGRLYRQHLGLRRISSTVSETSH